MPRRGDERMPDVPADFDSSRRYPLMMYQYNGPDSQTVLNEWKMDGVYYIASQGYVVAMVDGRGTGTAPENGGRMPSTAISVIWRRPTR